MHTAAWIVIAVLLIVAAVLTFWPAAGPAAVPGQYPIMAPRFQWPVVERNAPYQPGPEMGSDAVNFRTTGAAKTICATGNPCDGTPLAGASPRG
jgi:hypothetical protein